MAGVFPFAGFFSKDEILWKAFSGGGVWLWLLGFLGAGLTAFYMMRLVSLTFFGSNRASEEVKIRIHESPATMTMPLVILAVLSLAGGWIGIPHFMGGANHFERWLEPVFHPEVVVADVHGGHGTLHAIEQGATGETVAAVATGLHVVHDVTESAHHVGEEIMEWTLASASLVWVLLFLFLGWWVYGKRQTIAARMQSLAGGVPYRILLNKYYVDEAYEAFLIKPGYALSERVLWKSIDVGLIDGLLVNGSALMVAVVSSFMRLFHNGMLRFYVYVFSTGILAFILYFTLSA